MSRARCGDARTVARERCRAAGLGLLVAAAVATACSAPATPHTPSDSLAKRIAASAAGGLFGSAKGARQGPGAKRTPTTLVIGQELYARRCASCHGSNGKPGRAPSLFGRSWDDGDSERIRDIIANGRGDDALANGATSSADQHPGEAAAPKLTTAERKLAMPAFANRLTESQIADLTTFLTE